MATDQEILDRKKAILGVLRKRGTLHFGKILEELPDKSYWKDKQAVNRDLNRMSEDGLDSFGDKGQIQKHGGGTFEYIKHKKPVPEIPRSFAAYGIGWEKSKVNWGRGRGRPSVGKAPPGDYFLGTNKEFERPVCFASQVGIYLLHDGAQTVYVGKTIRPSDDTKGLYARLRQHHRSKKRWTKFSWFGFLEVECSGTLSTVEYIPKIHSKEGINILQLVTTIEAVIIEGIGCRDNSRGGDTGGALHFEQVPFESEDATVPR